VILLAASAAAFALFAHAARQRADFGGVGVRRAVTRRARVGANAAAEAARRM
jgi:hypothetical protein